MVGLAGKITKNFRSKSKEDLVNNELENMFKSSWFYDADLDEEMPMIDVRKLKKIVLVDGSNKGIDKYLPAVMAMLNSISAITYVKNISNVIRHSYKKKTECIKKKPYWPVLDCQHARDKDDNNYHVVSIDLGRTEWTSMLASEPSVVNEIKERGRSLVIGKGHGNHSFKISAKLDEDYNLIKIEFSTYRPWSWNKYPTIDINPGEKLTIEKFLDWYLIS